jgi:hypothetical protein
LIRYLSAHNLRTKLADRILATILPQR